MITDSRNVHPNHMHEAILAQPEAFVRSNGTMLRTVAQEKSSAHTVSYARAVSVVALLTGRDESLLARDRYRAENEAKETSLACDPTSCPLLSDHPSAARFVGYPASATAVRGSLLRSGEKAAQLRGRENPHSDEDYVKRYRHEASPCTTHDFTTNATWG
jgi:hypothetical protein